MSIAGRPLVYFVVVKLEASTAAGHTDVVDVSVVAVLTGISPMGFQNDCRYPLALRYGRRKRVVSRPRHYHSWQLCGLLASVIVQGDDTQVTGCRTEYCLQYYRDILRWIYLIPCRLPSFT